MSSESRRVTSANRWWTIGLWIALIVTWELLVRFGIVSGLFLPKPTSIAESLARTAADGTLEHQVFMTMLRIVVGLVCGGGLGLVVGLAMGVSMPLRRVLDPIVAALHPIPRLAFFPLLIVVFGIGEVSKLAAISLAAFFPIVLNTTTGVRNMNPVHIELARNYGANKRQMFMRVLLPGSMPLILTGLRLSASVAFHATIGVEMVGSPDGLGSMLWLSWQTFRIDQLYAVLAVIAALGIGLAKLIRWVTARGAPWLVDAPGLT